MLPVSPNGKEQNTASNMAENKEAGEDLLQRSKDAKREAFRLKEEYRALQKAAEAAAQSGDADKRAQIVASIKGKKQACRRAKLPTPFR